MRILATAVAIALLTTPAYSQTTSSGKKNQGSEQKSEEQQQRKKAEDKAYSDALSRIPASNQKPDPWRNMRGADR